MPLIYYVMIIMTSAGSAQVTGPFPSEHACEETKAAIVQGADLLKKHDAKAPLVIVACKRVASRPEKAA